VDQLLRVLDGALERVRPGGHLFVGDVRSLALLEAFHAAVQLEQARDDRSCAEVAERARRQAALESELLVDPAFFRTWASTRKVPVEVHLFARTDHTPTEMNLYRYDVVVHRLAREAQASPQREISVRWGEDTTSLEDLANLVKAALDDPGPVCLVVGGLHDRRIARDVRAAASFRAHDGPDRLPALTARAFRDELAAEEACAVDLRAVEELGASLDCTVAIGPADSEGRCEAVLLCRGARPPSLAPCQGLSTVDAARYANDPLRVRRESFVQRDLTEYLSRVLPSPMAPSRFVLVNALPRTTNGKVDRPALAALGRARPLRSQTRPRDDAEKALVAIFCEVLDRHVVGIDDNFFELGGDSIRAVQVAARARNHGLTLRTQDIFLHPTIAELAPVAGHLPPPSMIGNEASTTDRAADWGDTREASLAQRWAESRFGGSVRAAPLLPVQQGLLFHTLGSADPSMYLTQIGIGLTGEVRGPLLEQAWNHVLRAHPALRASFHAEGPPEPVQVVHDAAFVRIQELDFSHAPDAQRQIREHVLRDRETPIDLTVAPAMRVCLLRAGDHRVRLLWTTHHILLDGWSAARVLADVAACYSTLSRGETPALRTIDGLSLAHRALEPRGSSEHQAFWSSVLSDAPTTGSLAILEAPRTQEPRGHQRVVARLSAGTTAALTSYARAHGLTLSTLVHAAWGMLLCAANEARDVVFGTTVSVRPEQEPEAEHAVGLFINTVPFRVRLDPQARMHEWLARLQESHAAVRTHGTPSLVDIRRWAGLSHRTLFHTVLIYESAPRFETSFADGLPVEGVEDFATSHYPLTVVVLPPDDHAGMELRAGFDPSRVSPDLALRLLDGMALLLARIAPNPDQTLEDVLDEVNFSPSLGETPFDLGIRSRRALGQAITAHPLVEDCAVLSRSRTDGQPGLVAYVVGRGAGSAAGLREYLAREHPGTPEPEAFVFLQAVPLDGNGGVDETALEVLPVLDERTLQDVRAHLARLGVNQCAPCLGRARRSLPRQHLSKLLPGWRRFPHADGPQATFLPEKADLPGEDRVLAPRAITPFCPLVFPEGSPSTLPDALVRAARERPGHGVTFLEGAGLDTQRLLYPELLGEARRVASGLRVAGVCPGSFVLVQCLLNRDMLLAFWGCTLAGAVPVLLGVPASFDHPGADLKRVEAACALLGPAVLADEATFSAIRSSTLLRLPHTQVLTLEPLRRMAPTGRQAEHDPDAPALVLLTSGSTGRPKAVIQTHRTLLSRCEGANQMNAVAPEDVAFNWMPIHHVGGIVSIHLQDVLAMASEVHAPTRDILADPLRWLDALARHGATMTWAPNFAFGLVNARLREAPERRWDLASVRLVVNAGETIVPSTAQRFMASLASSGLSPRAMVPGWGMSETCSGTNYSHDFHAWDPNDQGGFLDLGPTIPGFQMRVVDGAGRVVAEGQPGSLEVRGAPVTPGYHDVGELNARAFSADGWLRTGDIALLRDGRLTLTGRRSDQIVVDGVNYHAHEIESAVEELPDVQASYTAACAVPDSRTGGDRLAIFFCPSSQDARSAPDSLASLVQSIRRHVVQRVGLNPALMVPVTASELPRTDIGKIKRRELAKRLIEGRFDDALDALDIATGSDDTLPDWFWQRTWRERRLPEPSEGVLRPGRTLVLADDLGLAAALEPLSAQHEDGWVVVHAGTAYHRHGPSRFTIDPADAGHYDRLAREIDVHAAPVRRVLHLWGYDDPTSVSTAPEDLRRRLDKTVVSGMLLVQMLLRNQGEQPLSLLFATAGGQVVGDGDAAEPASSAIAGLVRTLPLEEPSVRTRWVDFEGLDPSQDARSLTAELRVDGGCPETAYRAGVRRVPRIRPAALLDANAPRPEPLVAHHGLVLVTGGLGGMGAWVARFLSERYQARLLLIGRTPTPGPALATLEASCPFVTYASVDVCDLAGLRAAVRRAEHLFSARLVAVFHLAGHGDVSSHWESGDAHRLRNESVGSLREMLGPKALGALAVRRLLIDHPTASYVAFSSVHGWFGGATLGSYSAASSFLDADAFAYAAREGRRVLSVAWSSWRGTGMSAQAPVAAVDAARALGFCALEPQQGIRSLEIALEQGWSHVLVGLDGTRAHVARHVDAPPLQDQEVLLCHTGAPPAVIACTDRFGVPLPLRHVSVSEIPLTPSGEVDQDRLASLAVSDPSALLPSLALSPLEQSLADVFRKVLGLGRAVGVHDNFFDLGADSLSLVKAHAMIVHDLGVTLSLVDLFQHTTIEKLAAHLGQNAIPALPSPATDPAEAGKELAAGRRERRRVRRERGRGGRE
jgi:acyl-CoA synthetase (AMP-forming)/AMP-acid ligase II/NAD(P)-dependent dehydrogenase (short-subunit alcohol dehydrogenase family)/aryl carrier-like protein